MLERNFWEATSGRFGFEVLVLGKGVVWLVVVDCLSNEVSLVFSGTEGAGSSSALLLLLFFFCTTAAFTSAKTSASCSLPFERRFFFVPVLTPTASTSFFDFFFSTRGNTFHPVKFSMNWQIISNNCLMGDGSDGDARIDFRKFCTAVFEGDDPPLIYSIESSGLRGLVSPGFICDGVRDSSRCLIELMLLPLHPIALHDSLVSRLFRLRNATPLNRPFSEYATFAWRRLNGAPRIGDDVDGKNDCLLASDPSTSRNAMRRS